MLTPPLQAATPQQQTTERWMPPKRERRQKAPTPVKGQKQVVLWNPNHKFLHIRDGEHLSSAPVGFVGNRRQQQHARC